MPQSPSAADPGPLPGDVPPTLPSIPEIVEFGKTHTPEEMEKFWLERVYQGDHVPQLTLRAVLLGGCLGSLMSIAHVYTTMKLGWSFGVTITAGVLSFMFWHIVRFVNPNVRPFTILENNCMQSTASAAGYSTGASLVTAFGAILLLEGKHVEWQYAAIWTFVTALLGTVIAIPMKRQMLNTEQLAFPSGIAAAETLRALYGRGREAVQKAIALVIAMSVGIVLALLRMGEWAWLEATHLKVPELLPFGGQVRGVPSKALPLFGFEPSVLLIGAGMITGMRVSLSMFASSALLYLVVGPMLIEMDTTNANVSGYVASIATKRDVSGTIIAAPLTRWALWTGTSLMVVASLTSVALQWQTIMRALRRAPTLSTGQTSGGVEVPAVWFWSMFIPLGLAAIAVEWACFRINPFLGLVSVVLSAMLALVACRATGETDTNPVGAMGKIAQLLFAVLAPGNVRTNLLTASIAANAASSSADLLTDLKAGYLLGANPRKQFLAQFIGVFFGTVAIVPAWYLMAPTAEVLESYNPPATNMWKAVAELLTKGIDQLPVSARWGIAIGGLLGMALPIVDRLVPKTVRPYLPSAMGLGLGWVVPFANSFAFAIGAIIAWVWEKLHKKTAEAFVVPLASGMVAGESMMAAILAMYSTVASMWAAPAATDIAPKK
jgi:OPT family oligopeptide transporter